MTTMTATTSPARRASGLFALAYQIRCECLKLARVPGLVIPTVLFPIMFFALFGLPNAGQKIGPVDAGAYILASFGAYSVLSVALFSFGASIAAERGLGWNRLTRVTPMNPLNYFLAKVITATIIGLIVLLALFAFGALTAHVTLAAANWALLVGRLLLGMAPFVALGLWIGYLAGPNSAPAVVNLIFLPLSFASGLFTPIEFLPKFVQDIAPYLPAYHSGMLARTVVGVPDPSSTATHLLWLAGYTVLFLAMAVRAYRRDEGKNFG